MADKAKTGKDQVFDVSKPGQTAAEASAKSIIVNNHPLLKDPMVVGDKQAEATPDIAPEESAASAPSASKLRIEPIHKASENTDDATSDASKKASDDSAPESPAKPEDTSDNDSTDSTDKGKTAAQADEVAERKAAERDAELEKLVESHKYYLPINQVVKRRHQRLLWIVLVLVIALGGAYAALDASVVKIPGVNPPTHFLRTNKP